MASAGPPLISGIVATDKWLTRFRTILVAVLGGTVLGIACLAFYTSFEAIRAYAVRSNGIAPEHGWAVPLMVDSFIVVALGADLWFTTTKVRRAWWEVWWPKLLLAGAAGVSFVLNVAHAEPTWAARGVALIPPVALVLGVELLMMVLRRATTLRATRLQVEAEAAQEAAMAAPLARIQIEAMRRPSRAPSTTLGTSTAPPARPGPAEAKAGALPRPVPAGAAVGGRGAAADTFREAVAAAKADDDAQAAPPPGAVHGRRRHPGRAVRRRLPDRGPAGRGHGRARGHHQPVDRPGAAARAAIPPLDPHVEPPAHPGAPADRHRQRRPPAARPRQPVRPAASAERP